MITDSAAESARTVKRAYPNSIAWHGASQLSAAAVATFALCALAVVLGGVGYAMAVGA
jgi:hypothetical protein